MNQNRANRLEPKERIPLDFSLPHAQQLAMAELEALMIVAPKHKLGIEKLTGFVENATDADPVMIIYRVMVNVVAAERADRDGTEMLQCLLAEYAVS